MNKLKIFLCTLILSVNLFAAEVSIDERFLAQAHVHIDNLIESIFVNSGYFAGYGKISKEKIINNGYREVHASLAGQMNAFGTYYRAISKNQKNSKFVLLKQYINGKFAYYYEHKDELASAIKERERKKSEQMEEL